MNIHSKSMDSAKASMEQLVKWGFKKLIVEEV
jgi:hypothetical protein